MDVVELFEDIEKLGEDDDESELDPGEQAALRYGAVAKGLALAAGKFVATVPLVQATIGGTRAWTGNALRGLPSIGALTPETLGQYAKPVDKQSFLGLFDLEAKAKHPRTFVAQDIQELIAMQPVVDSFIDKYDLARKGVKMDFRYSPWGLMRGAGFDATNKTVTMPRLSKEILLHELGHAADYTAKAGLTKKMMQGVIPAALLEGLIPAAYFVGDEIKKAIPGSIDDHIIDFTQKHGPALAMLAVAAKSLYPEGKASYLAIKHIHDVEGVAAAKAAAKKLIPMFGTYALATLPILAGFAMAKKAFFAAKERQGVDKQAGVIRDVGRGSAEQVKDLAGAVTDVGRQMWHGLAELTRSPDPVQKLFSAGATIAKSPQFRTGAIYTGVPAAVAAYLVYAHPGGKARRDKIYARQERLVASGQLSPRKLEKARVEREYDAWREQNPGKWAARVGLAAGITGGLMAKMFHDIGQVV